MGDQNITLKTSSSSHWGHLDCTLSTLATLWKQHASPAAVAAAVLNHFVFRWSAAVQSEKFRQQSRPNTLYIVPEKIAEKQVWNDSFEMRPKQFLCRCSLQCFHIYHFSGIWNQIWSSSHSFLPVLPSYICGSVCNAAEDLFCQIHSKINLVSLC